MRQPQPVSADWRTSSFCSTGNCIQVAAIDDSIALRDSKNPDAVQMYSRDEWNAFLDGVTDGDFAIWA
ncbi:DUF397 domain-containing protein [Actinoplanes sp. NPDC049802]|uniref:DUF397 domain-containing protein n=1 Tax=Actinoplanes sp. NPDC049802 TaxID=3154742 RepID=UPI0033DB0DE5